MMRSRAPAVLALVVSAFLSLVGLSRGHCSCAPCLCDVISNREVAAVTRQCTEGYFNDAGAGNRTLQLLEVISQKGLFGSTQGCQFESRAFENLVDQARLTQHESAIAAATLAAELKSRTTSWEDAAEYSRQIQERVGAITASALRSSEYLSESVAGVLSECFNAEPAAVNTFQPLLAMEKSAGAATQQTASADNVAVAWGLTVMAGASTVVGALMVGFATPGRLGYLSFLEAFTAGVMLQGSLAGMSAQSAALVADASMHHTAAFWLLVSCFFAGAGACVALEIVSHRILGRAAHAELSPSSQQQLASGEGTSAGMELPELATLEQVVPEAKAGEITVECGSDVRRSSSGSSSVKSDPIGAVVPHDVCSKDVTPRSPSLEIQASHHNTRPSPSVIIAGVTLHNMAEGMATFTAALLSTRLGLGLAVAMVLHNIPEGISIAAPYYHAYGSRWKGIMWASVAGAAEILAALIVYIVYLFSEESSSQNAVFACLFAVASGMMTYIALYELYPAALAASPTSKSIPGFGIFVGIFIMQITLGQLGIPPPSS